MKFYDFVDKPPAIGTLVVIEGTERALADRALEILLDRLLPPEVRELNVVRFAPEEIGDFSRVREAVAAMPFLADRRVTVVAEAQTLRAAARRDLLAAAQSVPEGNTLAILDLLSPRSKKPQALGAQAGRAALRIDTTAAEDVRARFVGETLASLGVKADARATAALVRSAAELSAVRNDLQKLALTGKTISLADLERESLSIEDPKAYKYATAVVEGRIGEALAIAHEVFANEPRNAAVPLLAALAAECGYLWELARGGKLPDRLSFRERGMRQLARRAGARRARRAHERALNGIEMVVTGRGGNDPDELRTFVEAISVELSAIGSR